MPKTPEIVPKDVPALIHAIARWTHCYTGNPSVHHREDREWVRKVLCDVMPVGWVHNLEGRTDK